MWYVHYISIFFKEKKNERKNRVTKRYVWYYIIPFTKVVNICAAILHTVDIKTVKTCLVKIVFILERGERRKSAREAH